MKKKFLLFIYFLMVPKANLANIVLALSERQPNGRDQIKPYADAKRLAKQINALTLL
jgi:hypothetical protein